MKCTERSTSACWQHLQKHRALLRLHLHDRDSLMVLTGEMTLGGRLVLFMDEVMSLHLLCSACAAVQMQRQCQKSRTTEHIVGFMLHVRGCATSAEVVQLFLAAKLLWWQEGSPGGLTADPNLPLGRSPLAWTVPPPTGSSSASSEGTPHVLLKQQTLLLQSEACILGVNRTSSALAWPLPAWPMLAWPFRQPVC